MESQKHGFIFEKIALESYCGVNWKSLQLTNRRYTAIHDLPKEYNPLNQNQNISVKSTGSNNICGGNPFRYIEQEFNNDDITIIIQYGQENDYKVIKYVKIIKTDVLKKKLKELDIKKLMKLKSYIKSLKQVTSDNRKKYKQDSKHLSNNLIKIHCKVDSHKQRRIQFSFNIQTLINTHPDCLISKNRGAYIGNTQMIEKIFSPRRIRGQKMLHRLSLLELQQKANQYNIYTKTPTKNLKRMKNKTKKHLIEEIKTYLDNEQIGVIL